MRSNTISPSIAILIFSAFFLSACPGETPKNEKDNNGIVIEIDQGGKTDIGIDTSTDLPKKPDDTGILEDTSSDTSFPDTSPDVGFDVGPDPDPNKLRIATWNIFYLDEVGQSSGGDSVKREPEDYVRLAGYLTKLKADLIALQEINGVAAARTLFPANTWDAECEDRDTGQNVCVVLRKSKQWKIERHPDLVSLRVGSRFLRAGLDFTISKEGYPSVRILAVHMKASCLSGMENPSCPTFFEQIDALETWIDERAATDEPFMILGDFNRFMTDDDPAWIEIDDGVPARAMLNKTVAADDTDCWFPTFIDHIILDDTTNSWLVDSAQQGFDERDFDKYQKILSDHCPLWADFSFPPT